MTTPGPANDKLELQREAVRRHRRRDGRGERVFFADLPHHDTLNYLVKIKFLALEDQENKAAIREAMSRLVLSVIYAKETS